MQHRSENAARLAGKTAATRRRGDLDRSSRDIVQLQAGVDIAMRSEFAENADTIESAEARAVE
jgi:hypothetical protein